MPELPAFAVSGVVEVRVIKARAMNAEKIKRWAGF
jgi:hypothetical protein